MYGSYTYDCMLQDSVQGTKGVTRSDVINVINQGVMSGGIGYNNSLEKNSVTIGDTVVEREPVVILGEGFKEWLDFGANYGLTERVGSRFAESTLNLDVRLRLPKWIKYIYTYDDLSWQQIPYGLLKMKGSIAVGPKTWKYAKHANIKWFESLDYLRHVTHDVFKHDLTPERQYNMNFRHYKLSTDKSTLRLEPVDGISMTLATLSDSPELVWKSIPKELLKHKPKRWVTDFLSGRLKTAVTPISGWGTDVIGYYGGRLLGSAISKYLSMSRPSYEIWNTLLVAINDQIPILLSRAKIRVIE